MATHYINRPRKLCLQYLSLDGYHGVSLENHFYEMIDDMSKQELITKGDAQKS